MAKRTDPGKPVILHVNTEKGFRGGEVQTLEIARRLQGRGFPSVLLAHRDSPLLHKARKEGVECVDFVPRGELDILSAMKLRKVAAACGASLVHCHTSQALGICYLSNIRKKGVKVVGTRRVSFPLKSKYSLRKYLAASKIITVSEAVGRGLLSQGVPQDKLIVVHSGIDIGRFSNLHEPRQVKERLGISGHFPVVGVVGALAHHKGHKTFLKAIGRIWMQFPGLMAIFVGDGPAAEDLKRSVDARAIPAMFIGHVDNVVPIYRSFDVFVLPSSSGEGSPAVIKEAAASEVPVVATNVGGTDEILRNNLEAILVPPSEPIRMADAIVRLATDKELSARLTTAASKRVAEFDFENVVNAHERIYKSLLHF